MSTETPAVTPIPLPDAVQLRNRDLLKVGLAGLRGRPLRATLSALGTAIGVAALAAVLGISTVSSAGLQQQIQALGTNLLDAQPSGTVSLGQRITLPDDSPDMVGRIAGVQKVSAVGKVPDMTIRRTDQIPPEESNAIQVVATRLDLLDVIGEGVHPVMKSGAFLNAATARYPTVVLGAVAADRLGIYRAGEQAYIGGRWFVVNGIMNSLPLAPDIDRSALIGWQYAVDQGWQVTPAAIYERSPDDTVDSIRNVLAATVSPEHPDWVQVSQPSDALTAELAAKSTLNALFLGLGVVALVVGGVGIANIMVIAVLERRQEIGLRRALGATRRQIRRQFLTESATLSLIGGVTGVLVGVGVTLGYALYRDWPIVIPIQAIVGGALASAVIGALAGIYPARRAAALPPTEALNSA